MKITILDASEEDLVSGYTFYELQQPELGQYFLDSIYADIESHIIYAGVHNKVFGLHRMLCKRFPFAIYYQKGANDAIVFAVLDMRQNPIRLSDRLS